MLKMELVSLKEEDSYGGLFLTQTPNENKMDNSQNKVDNNMFLGVDQHNFQAPCISLLQSQNAIYSDISDDDMPPSSQMEIDQPNFE